MPISSKPWGQFSESDYTLAQYHRACLIHRHTEPPTSKDECSLPVREPDGTLNEGGVVAAYAVLRGARGGVKATPEQKKRAARALARLYREAGMDVPEPLRRLAA